MKLVTETNKEKLVRQIKTLRDSLDVTDELQYNFLSRGLSATINNLNKQLLKLEIDNPDPPNDAA